MEEKKNFINNSKLALKGALNGIVGASVYELMIAMFITMVISMSIASKNPSATQEELNVLSSNVLDSFPFSILVTCLGSIVTLAVFVFLIGFNKIKDIFKNTFSKNAFKHGFIGLCSIIVVTIMYNSIIMMAFNLDVERNSNQQLVVELIKSNIFLGFLSVVILAPIVEELTCRYCLFGGIYKKNKWVAYIVSGVFFGLMHFVSSVSEYGFSKDLLVELLYLPPYIFSGLMLCYVYDKSDNIGSSFIAHLLNNFISFLGVVCL